MAETLLSVDDLVTTFRTDSGTYAAVDGVSFDVAEGETLAIVGESGSGKSVTALSILRLVEEPPGKIARGRVLLRGKDLRTLSEKEMQGVRGGSISMIFQEPMTSLNPVYTVGSQIVEAIRLHTTSTRSEARERAIALLRKVGIPSPETNVDAYPHQLSGGMRQRVMIAMALACEPEVLIADEPTTALDVTIQAQILELLRKLQAETGMAIVLITHDLGVVAEYADEVVVMYAGKVVERARAGTLFATPKHPYTRGLIESLPRRGVRRGTGKDARLPTIAGVVPDLASMPEGCRFADRCPFVADACRKTDPPLVATDVGSFARCVRLDEVG
ncbi:MAG: ABC transporter ATP-binding protein [Polyangiaceae bacterium]